MTSDEQSLLDLMRRDNAQAGFPFAPRGVWDKLCRDFDRTFVAHGVPKDDIAFYNQSFSQSPPGNPRYHRYAVYMLWRLVRERDTTGILDRLDLSTDTGLEIAIEDRRYSWDTLISVDTLLSVAEVDPGILSEPRVVADLGSGWGRIGWVLKRVNPRATYLALDLPEILMISMTLLPRMLPGERASLYGETRPAAVLTRARLLEKGLWFAGSQDILKVEDGAIDLFINVASFQEMKPAQVQVYFDLIDRKVGGLFYTQQYVVISDAQRQYGAIAGLEAYPFKPTWTEHFRRHATFSERFFEACFGIGQAVRPNATIPAASVVERGARMAPPMPHISNASRRVYPGGVESPTCAAAPRPPE